MKEKIDIFKNMDGWQIMLDQLTDIPVENREASFMQFINFICGPNV